MIGRPCLDFFVLAERERVKIKPVFCNSTPKAGPLNDSFEQVPSALNRKSCQQNNFLMSAYFLDFGRLIINCPGT